VGFMSLSIISCSITSVLLNWLSSSWKTWAYSIYTGFINCLSLGIKWLISLGAICDTTHCIPRRFFRYTLISVNFVHYRLGNFLSYTENTCFRDGQCLRPIFTFAQLWCDLVKTLPCPDVTPDGSSAVFTTRESPRAERIP
jgi:hypothetical protein